MSTLVPIDRRKLVGGAWLAGLGLPSLLSAAPLSAVAGADGSGNGLADVRRWLRLVGDLSGRPMFAVTRGDVWGFKPQADDLTIESFAKRLYGYWSVAARQVRQSGDGYVLTTKAWSFYTDDATGEIADRILNPYMGRMVSCPPISGPQSSKTYSSPSGAGLDLGERRMGERAWISLTRISRFRPSDTTWFKLEADLTSYGCSAVHLDNLDLTHVPNTWSHNLVAEWQTWMHMHGEPGHILFKGDGGFVAALDDLPPPLRAGIERFFPGTLSAVVAWRAS